MIFNHLKNDKFLLKLFLHTLPRQQIWI